MYLCTHFCLKSLWSYGILLCVKATTLTRVWLTGYPLNSTIFVKPRSDGATSDPTFSFSPLSARSDPTAKKIALSENQIRP